MVLDLRGPHFTPSRNTRFEHLKSGLTDAQTTFEGELDQLVSPVWHWASPQPWSGPMALRGNRQAWLPPRLGQRHWERYGRRDTCWWAGNWASLGVKAGRAWALKRRLRMVVKGDDLCERRRRRDDGHEGWDWERGTLCHSASRKERKMMFW